MSPAIVIGGNHHNTLGVIRALGRKGIRPYVILTSHAPASPVLKSKYIAKSWQGISPEEIPVFLKENFRSTTEKPVIFACQDIVASVLDRNREILLPYFSIPGTTSGIIPTIMDKYEMAQRALPCGFNIPYTTILTEGSSNSSIPFPCITKAISVEEGGKQDIHICENAENLNRFLQDHPKRRFLVQEFIAKDFEYQLIGCSLAGGKKVIIPGVSRLIRPGRGSNTGFLKYELLSPEFDKAVTAAEKFLKSVEYSGLFSVECLRDKEGRDYFMETNFRNDGNGISVTNAGVNLPYIWYLSCQDKDISRELASTVHEEYVMPEFSELALWYTGNISWETFRKDMHRATSFMDYAQDDPTPTRGWKTYNRQLALCLLKHPLKRIIGRLKVKS